MNGGTIGQNLARHVRALAGDIGERNVFCPAALQAAADYITGQWEAQGWMVGEQAYVAQGVRSANLEVVLPGTGAAPQGDSDPLWAKAHAESYASQGDSDPHTIFPGLQPVESRSSLGLRAEARVESYAPQGDSDPLRAEARVESYASEIILLGAHYDSVVGSPGANDNASGVAALLEIARCLAGRRFRRTVRLVAFVNEEPPFFFWGNMGSMVYAKAARARGDDIRLMLSLETMGCYRDEPGSQRYPPLFRRFHPDRGNFIAFVSNFRSRPALKAAVAAFKANSDFPMEHTATFGWIPGVAWSDHYAFWRQGYQALMVTDTAFFRYPWYHTSEDTPEKLDYARLAQVTAGLCGAVAALAEEVPDGPLRG